MQQGRLQRFELADYEQMRRRQLEAVQAVAAGDSAATLFLGTHNHVITLGRRSDLDNLQLPVDRDENFVAEPQLPQIIEIERGGDATYHGPGQLIGYPIIHLGRERNLHGYLRNLEALQIHTLKTLGIAAGRREGLTGVWVGKNFERKIASIGIAVKRWVTYHGFALNVCTDLRYFSLLKPCGLDAEVMTSISEELGQRVEVESIIPPLLNAFREIFKIDFVA